MKKLFFSAILALSISASSFAAGANKVHHRALSSFATQFNGAKDVKWTTTDNFIRASFILDNVTMETYYDLHGNTIGTSSSIAIESLPTNAKRYFAKKYADYTVKEATRFEGTDEIAYYIFAETDVKTLILKVSEAGNVEVFKHQKK